MIEHLRPDLWAEANRRLTAKALSELAHEKLIEPRRDGDRWVVGGWSFRAERLPLDHWLVDPASVEPADALQLVVDLREALGLEGERLGIYLEEITATLAAMAYKLSLPDMTAAELAAADFQTIESRMTDGHPCFIANSGRLGWSAEDFLRYAPEAAEPVRLEWVAAHRDHATASGDGPIPPIWWERRLEQLGHDPGEYVAMPVHPWQWRNRIAVTFAADVARGRLVHLGEGDDSYLAQQSIRTFFNASDPARPYVKTALSVINMGFVRGLSAAYMDGTPAINDWVAGVVDGFEVLREHASVGYRSETYAEAEGPYAKMLAALWRESPVPRLAPGERLATMASLLHVDRNGDSLARALIESSGLGTREWLRRYLDAYLRPLLHCFYAHDLVFMPHGENIILVLRDDAVERVILKDIAEEVVLMDPERELPEAVERIRADVPGELKALSLLTDVVDCFLRHLGALVGDELWDAVAACILDYQDSNPQLADRFREHDLLAPTFALSCLNRLQLRNPRQMVDLQDPAGSLQLVGELENPLYHAAHGHAPRVPLSRD